MSVVRQIVMHQRDAVSFLDLCQGNSWNQFIIKSIGSHQFIIVLILVEGQPELINFYLLSTFFNMPSQLLEGSNRKPVNFYKGR
jgi:hypothetical protein